jgi:hypothetical protein
MDKFKIIIMLIFLLVGSNSLSGNSRPEPDWDIDVSAYEFNAGVIARIIVNNEPDYDLSSILAAFCEDECRGLANPILFGDDAIYFLTVYSNHNGQQINFQLFQAETELVIELQENIIFEYNQIYGSVLEPLELHGFVNYDHPPYVSGIPDQTIGYEDSFNAVSLNDYLTELDGDQIVWSANEYTNLQVEISDNIAVITRTDPEWTGSETITFTATDQTASALCGSDSALFTVLNPDHPPLINDIPDQSIPMNQDFEMINLNQYLVEIDGDTIRWEYHFADNTLPQPVPVWQAIPANYELTMSMTIQVISEGYPAEGSDNLLGAFCDNECRGIAYGQSALGGWLYFLTVYASTSGDEISFRFYDCDQQKELPVCEIVNFTANGVIGNPLEPYLLHAGNLLININDSDQVEISIVDPSWFGSQTVIFTASDQNTDAGYADSDDVTFSVLPDHAPQILPIADQSIYPGEEFDLIFLDDYLVELDGDEVFWSNSAANNLNVIIDADNIAEITAISPAWLGSEIITFTATDATDFAASCSVEVCFSVQGIDHPPSVNGIPDQTIAAGMEFESVLLNDYLAEIDDDQIGWSYWFPPETEPEALPNLQINPSNYEFSINLTVEITTEGYPAEGNHHFLFAVCQNECRGISSAIFSIDKWLYFLTVYSNSNGEEISFEFYDTDKGRLIPVLQKIVFSSNQIHGNPLQPVQFQAGRLMVMINSNSEADISITNPDWMGVCLLQFIARDTATINGFSDYDEILLSIIEDQAPQIIPIDDQTIFAGDDFEMFDLDDHLVELDGDPVLWSWSGETFLQISVNAENIVTITPPSNYWTGSETITFRVEDDTGFSAWDTEEATYTVLPEDHPPLVTGIPDQVIYCSESFQPVHLPNYLTELDGDHITWSYEFLPNDQTQTAPDWDIDPTDYQYTMTLTAEILSKGVPAEGNLHLLAVFADNECRGITSALYSLDKWLYFLTIYANQENDLLSFRFYDYNFQQILPTDEIIHFQNNLALGNPLDPVQLSAGFLKICLDNEWAHISLIDDSWIGSEIVNFTATDQGTIQQLSASDQVQFSTRECPQFDLPASFTFQENGTLPVDFSQFLINADPQNFLLSTSGNQMISVDIDDFMVTFSSAENWSGNEMISFSAHDQQRRLTLSDSVDVIVTPNGDINVTKNFAAGWNWFSINIWQENMDINLVMSSIGESGSSIKNQTNAAMFYQGFGWLGSMTEMNNISLYKLACLEPVNWQFSGHPICNQETIYDLNAGWNWISFAPQSIENINSAFSDLEFGHIIKSQTQGALFYAGIGWLGSLSWLQPLSGYMLQMNEAEQFSYPDPEPVNRQQYNMPEFAVKDADWILNYPDYEYNSALIIELVCDYEDFDPSDYFLGIFSELGECRGIACYDNQSVLDYKSNLGKIYHMPMVYSDTPAGDLMHIKAYNRIIKNLLPTDYSFVFDSNTISGNWDNPIKIEVLSSAQIETENMMFLSCAPNPFNPSTKIDYHISEPGKVSLEIFNLKGQKVHSLVNQNMAAGNYSILWQADHCASGIFFARLKAPGQAMTKKLILIK